MFVYSVPYSTDNQDCGEVTGYLIQLATNSVPGKLNNEEVVGMHKVIVS